VASSDSGGGAGIQADLKAFAAAHCYGTCAIVALTAQSTAGVFGILEVPPEFIRAQLDAVVGDIGCDAAKTGALVSKRIVEVVADFFATHRTSLVVDPVMVATSGYRLLAADAVDAVSSVLLPLATVVTPNLAEAKVLAGVDAGRAEMAERIVARGARAVVITGGHAEPPHDHFFDGVTHIEIPQTRVMARSTHGSGCTHSATLTAELAKGASLLDAARVAASVTAASIAAGVDDLGSGEGPVDVLQTARP
jgi:hydroxymethylpyrimidine/phosphomethylpyrimidine kinase